VALKAEFSNGTKKSRRDVTEKEILKDLGKKNAMHDTLDIPPNGDVNYSYKKSADVFKFDVKGDWNSVSIAKITSTNGDHVVLNDFVQVAVKIKKGDSDIDIRNTKRGEIITGAGDDDVSLSLLTNNDDNSEKNSNKFNISTKGGDDDIVLTRGSQQTAGNNHDKNGSWIYNPWDPDAGSKNAVTDGSLSYVTINAGAGNDTVDLSAIKIKQATIIGGDGDDIVTLGAGADILVFKAGETGTDEVIGFNMAEDSFVLFGEASDWTVENTDGDTVLTNGEQVITIRDVVLTADDVGEWF
jgi:Ca2+-binding RTX toxin-like protein